MRALQGMLRGQAGELGHEADEADAAHRCDVGIVLRHVAEQGAHFAGVRADVLAEDARGSGSRLVEAEQRVDQRALARSVRPQQADGAPGQGSLEFFQDGAVAEAHFKSIQFYDGVHSPI